MRSAGLVTSIGIAVGTGLLLGPLMLSWKPPTECGDIFGADDLLLPPPAGATDLFFRTGIVGLDNGICALTHFFKDAQTRPSVPIAQLSSALLFSVFVAMGLFQALESTRRTARGFIAWPAITGTLSQIFGVSFVVPALWLPTFFYSYPTPLAKKPLVALPVADVSLGSVALVGLIGLGAVAFATIYLLMTVATDQVFQLAFVVFQFWPTFFPLLWPILRLVSPNPTTKPAAGVASVVASALYRFFALALALHYYTAIVAPLVRARSIDAVVASVHFLVAGPTTNSAMPQWFLLVDAVSLFTSQCLLVLSESSGRLATLVHFLVGSVVVGPGAALALFCATREDAIRSTHFTTGYKSKRR
ncbi:hypothetical protein ACHHYP_05282 [Achlya hypogyna]|uniref:Transmembrane protein n=1 Tax=Achlya hypogyna TaxID=1202772 RepID=A0A1V9YY70_ACHHY|nr:hypothetical protein ACHHYP_05282 [Achlya hypogyna]